MKLPPDYDARELDAPEHEPADDLHVTEGDRRAAREWKEKQPTPLYNNDPVEALARFSAERRRAQHRAVIAELNLMQAVYDYARNWLDGNVPPPDLEAGS